MCIRDSAGKTQTQNTFFHIFNHLHQSNKQLVLTCDRPPVELVGMVSRLLTRFKWGLTAEVERPDYELRYDILMSKVRRDGLSISEEVIDYIAPVSYTHLRAHETGRNLVCRLLLEKKKNKKKKKRH